MDEGEGERRWSLNFGTIPTMARSLSFGKRVTPDNNAANVNCPPLLGEGEGADLNAEQSEQSEQCRGDVSARSAQYPAEDGSIPQLAAASRLISDKIKRKRRKVTRNT